jgi:hypothetical protein
VASIVDVPCLSVKVVGRPLAPVASTDASSIASEQVAVTSALTSTPDAWSAGETFSTTVSLPNYKLRRPAFPRRAHQ